MTKFELIYILLIVIKIICIFIIYSCVEKQIDDLNNQINDLRGQSMKLYSIQNDTFSNRKNVKK